MCVASQLTTDREQCVGLLSLHRGHTFKSIEPSPADVYPTLNLCLSKRGTEQCDGDDIVLLPGGIHLLGAPGCMKLYIVIKYLRGSPSYSSVVPVRHEFLS